MSDVEGDDVPVAAAAPVSTGPMDINTAIQVEDITVQSQMYFKRLILLMLLGLYYRKRFMDSRPPPFIKTT